MSLVPRASAFWSRALCDRKNKEVNVPVGEYFVIANLDKKEFLQGHEFGSGVKLGETAFNQGASSALVLLLAGRWRGDRIAVCGDEAHSFEGIYELCIHEEAWKEVKVDELRAGRYGDNFNKMHPVGTPEWHSAESRVVKEFLPGNVVDCFARCKEDVPRSLRHAIEEELAKLEHRRS